MTAEVIIMNKRGVAIAADSATTWKNDSETSKVVTSTNKIKVISENPPIAMVHNNHGTFCNLAWSIVVQSFRDSHPEPWKSLDRCAKDFLKHLSRLPIEQESVRKDFIHSCSTRILKDIKSVDQDYIKCFLEETTANIIHSPFFQGMGGEKPAFDKKTLALIDKVFHDAYIAIFQDSKKPEWFDLAKNTLLHALQHPCDINKRNFTGIAFVGFGTDDFYPVERDFFVYGNIGNRLAYTVSGSNQVSAKQRFCIIPMAQRSEIDTFFFGAQPEISSFIQNDISRNIREAERNIHNFISANSEKLSSFESDLHEVIQQRMNALENRISSRYHRIINQMTRDTSSTVNFMTLPDLAKFAQGLIDSTSFKRSLQQKDPGTVGGETEVAVLARTDGFVWVRHKKFIDQEINQNFFSKVDQ